MCGIAGWIGHVEEPQRCAARLVGALRHRGPDSEDVHASGDATLVHTRLSIIDLSPTGAQPMSNEDGSVVVVFNGEIYNHHQLRHDLESRGHSFRGRSDTEVLPHLYEEEGAGFAARLRGMFAIAVYDMRQHRLLLVRDRFGIKPLFYAPGRDRLAFASEINAVRELPDVDDRPDRQAIADYAALFFIPAPETFYRGIRALEPGEILTAELQHGRVSYEVGRYHQWIISPRTDLTLERAETDTAELLLSAVSPQLESDVPLGALLSGGIDSSLVSAAAQRTLATKLRTFNVSFAEPEYDETWAAHAVADHVGSVHETLELKDGTGTWEHVARLLQHAGQPFADTSLFAVHAVCRLMRQRVTVALSGDGGDEAFGGYDLYPQLRAIAAWQKLPVTLARGISEVMGPLARRRLIPERLPQRLAELAGADDATVLQNCLCWVREAEHQRLCEDRTGLLPVRRLFEAHWEHRLPATASRLERLSAHATEVQVRLILPNDFLFKVDLASMRESLEVRVPMLDEDLFAYGLGLPHRLKVNASNGKRVLRAVADEWLPAAVARKPKRGFEIAVDHWVDDRFKLHLKDALMGGDSRLRDVFRPDAYRPLLQAFCDGVAHPGVSRQGLYQRVIMLLAVHLALTPAVRRQAA
jgi:asparagine synthase (glutamine-hydrolysing)